MYIGNYHFNGVIGGGEYNLEIAKKAYQKAISINPKILWGHYQLARIYFVKGEKEKALEEINKELEANPENLRSLYVRGLIYGYRNYLGDLVLAENDFRNFTHWAPKEWAGYNDLAWILAKQGKYKETRDTIFESFGKVQGGTENVWLQNSLGVAYLNLKDYKNAKIAFIKAKAIAEKMSVSEWQRAYPGNDLEESGEAFPLFKDAIEQNLKKASFVDNS
jgi:Tfp pilus assembly protein PilF